MTNLSPSETGRLDRLPAWARDAILRLDRELTGVIEERNDLYRSVGEPSGLSHDVTALRVPKHKYLHAASESWTDGIRARFDHGVLEITANGPLLIKTTASNSVHISEAGR